MDQFENGLVFLGGERLLRSNSNFGHKIEGARVPQARLELFSTDWLDLQAKTALITRVPATELEFTSRYGTVSAVDRKTIQDVIAGNNAIKAASSVFGSPTNLKSTFTESFFSDDTAPSEVYAHIVWMANRISRNAKLFRSRLKTIEQLIDPTHRRNAAQRRDALLDLMIGQQGMIPAATALEKETKALCAKLETFIGSIADSKGKFDHYATSRSAIVASMSDEIRKIQSDIDGKFRPAETGSNWKFWAVVAVVVVLAIVIVVLSCGAAGPLVAGGLTLTAAGKATAVAGIVAVGGVAGASYFRSAYKDAAKEIARLDEEKRKKTELSTDLAGLSSHVDRILPALQTVLSSANNMNATWSEVGNILIHIKEDFTVNNLQKQPSASLKSSLRTVARSWGLVASSAEDFVGHSLIDVKFARMGDPLPSVQSAAA